MPETPTGFKLEVDGGDDGATALLGLDDGVPEVLPFPAPVEGTVEEGVCEDGVPDEGAAEDGVVDGVGVVEGD